MSLNVKSFSMIHSLKNKKNLIILSCIIILIFIATVFLLNLLPERTAISGTLFINSIQAPMGVEVKIVFPDGEVFDLDGTDEQGRYYIDVSGFIDEIGTFFINYNGTVYSAQNHTGGFIEMTLVDSIELLELDLFVYTTSDDPSDHNDSSEDDASDDSHDDISDTNDNTSSAGTDNDNVDDYSNSGSGTSNGDDNNQNTQDDEFTINATAGTGGIIDPNDSIIVSSGDYLNFSITPDVGYHIVDILIDNISQGSISYYNFSNINDNHEIHAEFMALNQPLIISEVYPNNQDVNYNPRLQVTVTDHQNDELTVIFRKIENNIWVTINTYTGYNGIYTQHTENMDIKNQTYYWSVNITDGESWVNQTYYFEAYPFVLKWTHTNAPGTDMGPISKDIDHDGIYEVFLPGAGKVICVNGSTGNLIWEYNNSEWIYMHSDIVLGDLNNDGIDEVVISCDYPHDGMMGRSIAVHANNGTEFWNVPVPSDYKQFIIADIDGTGYPYVYMCSHTPHGWLTKIRGYDGAVLAQQKIYYPCHGGMSIADLNNDGNFELLLADYNGGPGKGIHCYDPDTLKLKWYNPTTRADPQLPVLADVNKDGVLDIVTSKYSNGPVQVINGVTGSVISGYNNLNAPTHSPVTVHDIDLDGNLEVLVCRNSGVSIFDLYTKSLDATLPEVTDEPPLMADVIGDEKLEILLTTYGGIHIYNSTYDKVEVLNQGSTRWTLVQDIDNDGQNELIFTDGENLFAYETSAYSPTPRVRTEQPGYSERNTGAGIYIPPPGAPQPILKEESPKNGSLDVTPNPTLSIHAINYQINTFENNYVAEHAYDTMNITISTNTTGIWQNLISINYTGNGQYNFATSNMNQPETTYYWNVTAVNIFTGITTTETYHFTTSSKPKIKDLQISPETIYQNQPAVISSNISDDVAIDEVKLLIEYPDSSDVNKTLYEHQWTTLTYDDFEDGFGNYEPGGDDCLLYSGASYIAHNGWRAANIQNNSGVASSFYLTNPIDITGYNAITIDFWMNAYSMEKNEKYVLEYYDGTQWITRKTYTQNWGPFDPTNTNNYDDTKYAFANWHFFHDTVWINKSTYNLPTDMNIRFRCIASNTDDGVYIDQIYINATHKEPTTYHSQEAFELLGLYNYSIWCKDINGNTNSSEIKQFIVIDDIEKPEITSVMATPNSDIQGIMINISAFIIDNAGIQDVRLNITILDAMTNNISFVDNKTGIATYYHVMDYYTLGTYSYFIWAIDKNGISNQSDIHTFEILDAPPMISNEIPANGTIDVSINPTLSATISDYSNGDVEWAILTNATGPWMILDKDVLSGGNGIISTNTNNMIDYTQTYYWSINISDGDDWVNQTYSFTTEPPDTTSPWISNILATPNTQNVGGLVNITCNVTDNKEVNLVRINVTYPSGDMFNETMFTGYYYNQTFSEIGTYSYFIWANDTEDNTVTSNSYIFNISADAAPVIIDNTIDTATTGEEVEINVTVTDTDTVSNVWVEHWFDSNPSTTDSMIQDGTEWHFTITVPINTSIVHYNVTAQDYYGFENHTGIQQITILDTMAPSIIDNTETSTGTGNSFIFNATATDNIEIMLVNVSYWYDGESPNEVTMSQIGDTNYYETSILIPTDSINNLHYNISTLDTTNNEIFTGTQDVIVNDDDAPIIQNIDSQPSNQTTGGSVNITCEVTDNIALDLIKVNITHPDISTENITMTYFENNVYYYNETYTETGMYTYFIWSNDTSDNKQQSSDNTFEITD